MTIEGFDDLYDAAAEGRRLRDKGMARTKAGTPPEYTAAFYRRWTDLETSRRPFTSEDVTAELAYPFELGSLRNNCIGALTAVCVRRGLKGGTLQRLTGALSTRPSAHAHRIAVYQGIDKATAGFASAPPDVPLGSPPDFAHAEAR